MKNKSVTENQIIIYTTVDGKAEVRLYSRDGMMWMNQKQIASLFATSVPNISIHIDNILLTCHGTCYRIPCTKQARYTVPDLGK
jgi:hypothetical protein